MIFSSFFLFFFCHRRPFEKVCVPLLRETSAFFFLRFFGRASFRAISMDFVRRRRAPAEMQLRVPPFIHPCRSWISC